MKSSILIAAATGALLLSATASAQVQQQQQQGDILGQLLGSIFGTNQQASEQTLESDWNQGRRPFEQRRATLDARIDTAVRDGSLSPNEADQMRREYDDIVRLEAQYSANGSVSPQQRSDLRTRYRALTQRVNGQNYGNGYNQGYPQPGYQPGYDNDNRWQPLSTRNTEFEQRLAAAVRGRTLTQAQANRLRTDWRSLAQIEANYQRGGLDSREQADLWTRFNALDARLGVNAFGYGINNGYNTGFGNDRNTARWTQMETRLAAAERTNRITRDDAAQVRAQIGDLARLDAAYSARGYSAEQRTYLTRRYAELDMMLGYNRR